MTSWLQLEAPHPNPQGSSLTGLTIGKRFDAGTRLEGVSDGLHAQNVAIHTAVGKEESGDGHRRQDACYLLPAIGPA